MPRYLLPRQTLRMLTISHSLCWLLIFGYHRHLLFWTVYQSYVVIEAISRFRKCGLPCGLCCSLCTLQNCCLIVDTIYLCPCSPGSSGSLVSFLRCQGFLSPTVTPLTGLNYLLHFCSTRYKWLVRPCFPGTFTLEETLSFAWRTRNSTSDKFADIFTPDR